MERNNKTWLERSAWMLATTALVIVACEKDFTLDNGPVQHDEKATSAAAVASVPYDDASTITDLAYQGAYDGKTYDALSCATITIDTLTSMMHRVTVDFGTGCTDAAGNTRMGVIRTTYTVPRTQGGATTDIEFINYYYNQIKVEGLYHQTYLGLNTANQPEWAVDIDGSAVYSPGDTLFYMSSRTRTWIDGFIPFDPSNIRFSITGTASGERTGDPSWLASTVDPLIWKYNCPYIVDGTYELSVVGLPNYQVDFGNGDCDNKAEVSDGNNTVIINL
ncbi:MAG: hypothetical protein HWE14_03300 [Flavobacteriia bacterium]|nr:hypothetical protein [Flavobacteriia bacterium]